MILTGKAKEDFENWVEKETGYFLDEVKNGFSLHVNALIIEWFDSVGYYIGIEPHIGGGVDVYYSKIVYRMDNFIDTWLDVENTMYSPIELHFINRQEATKQAILKCNTIYNESKN